VATAEQERGEEVSHLSRGGNCRKVERGGGQSSLKGRQLQNRREVGGGASDLSRGGSCITGEGGGGGDCREGERVVAVAMTSSMGSRRKGGDIDLSTAGATTAEQERGWWQ
jgi:hypothetical protein